MSSSKLQFTQEPHKVQMVYAIIISCAENYRLQRPIEDDDGIYYGLTRPADNKWWKNGCDTRVAHGYFQKKEDALKIAHILDLDPDVQSGDVMVEVIEQPITVLNLYQGKEKIILDTFYLESCVNTGTETFNVKDACVFLKD